MAGWIFQHQRFTPHRYAGPAHLTDKQRAAQLKKARGDGVIMKIGSIAQGFVEDALTTFSDLARWLVFSTKSCHVKQTGRKLMNKLILLLILHPPAEKL